MSYRFKFFVLIVISIQIVMSSVSAQTSDVEKIKAFDYSNGINIPSEAWESLKNQDKPFKLVAPKYATNDELPRLQELKNLEYLDLSECPKVTDAGMKHIAALKQLRELDMSQCEVTDYGLKEISKLQNLEVLILDFKYTKYSQSWDGTSRIVLNKKGVYDGITDEGLIEVGKLKNLKKLVLINCCDISDEGLMKLPTGLRILNISYCGTVTPNTKDNTIEKKIEEWAYGRITSDWDFDRRRKMGSRFRYNTITDKSLEYFSTFKSLTTLNISNCNKQNGEWDMGTIVPGITNKGIKKIAALPSLSELNIAGCGGVTYEGLEVISQMRQLRSLDISGCSTAYYLTFSTIDDKDHLRMLRALDEDNVKTGKEIDTFRSEEKLVELLARWKNHVNMLQNEKALRLAGNTNNRPLPRLYGQTSGQTIDKSIDESIAYGQRELENAQRELESLKKQTDITSDPQRFKNSSKLTPLLALQNLETLVVGGFNGEFVIHESGSGVSRITTRDYTEYSLKEKDIDILKQLKNLKKIHCNPPNSGDYSARERSRIRMELENIELIGFGL